MAEVNKKVSKVSSYNAEDIDVFEGLQAIRKRPEMYIGSRGSQGLHHLAWEVIDNSVDEYLAGFCNLIEVTINNDGSFTGTDNGRGMPVDEHPKFKRPAIEILLTIPHAGGKFGGKGYSVSGGLHGVGVKAVNALSKKLVAQVRRDGRVYDISYIRGEKQKELTSKKASSNETGTSITFQPDEQIFRETTAFDRKTISDRLYESSFLNKGLRIIFKDLREDVSYEKEYYSEDGIKELLEIKTANLKSYTKEMYFLEKSTTMVRENPDSGEKETVEAYVNVVFKYTNSDNDSIYSFVNNIKTKDGEHVKGFKKGLINSFNEVGRDLKFIKEKEDNIKDKDVLSGIVAIIYIRFPEPRFEGQTKENLASKEINEVVLKAVSEEALVFFKKNKTLVKQVIDFSREQEKMREEYKAAKETTTDNSFLMNSSLPGKLADCTSNDTTINEVYLVEGDSAGGTAKQGRDRFFQAILALRGKVLNVQGQKVRKALDNKEIESITTALGCGVKDLCDPSKARYGKIIILTDADVDGAHIQALLLTFFFHYMRPYIEDGRLFIAKPPLFKVTFKNAIKNYKKDQFVYFYSDQELNEAISNIANSNIEIQRYKGLGEMNAEQLWETTLDPSVRKLEQVLISDFIHAETEFEKFMGGNSEDKVEFIKKVIKAYKYKKQHIAHIEELEELAELDLSSDELSKEIEKDLSKFKNVIEQNIELRSITNVLKSAIGDYAYYVNTKRNIPDIRDGLKPVQRRIIWAMHKESMVQSKPYKKSARVVGEVIGKYHPHGDTAIYESLVKLAQSFHENIPILDFHGNVGSIDGDPAAAMRYTETRMNPAAEDMVEFIDSNTVEFEDNFSREYKEPIYLPGKFPYILINGTQGVGVSISTNIPAHNPIEVFNALKYVINNPNCTVKDIMKYIKAPDFPSGGIFVEDNLQKSYETGNGTYKIRAKIHTEIVNKKQSLVITEIPYNVDKDYIIKKIGEVCYDRKKDNKIIERKISDIVDYRDESNRLGIRLILILKSTANAEKVKKDLYDFTPLESNYKINLLAIENEEIRIFNLKDMINSYISHRQTVLTKKYNYDLEDKERRKHLVEGYIKILKPSSNLDKAIAILRESKDSSDAKTKLMKAFDLTEVQAMYILDRRLATLSKADVKKYEEELKSLKIEIVAIRKILGDINEINLIIIKEIDEMIIKYPIKRLTEIISKDVIDKTDLKSEVITNAEEIYVGLDIKSKFKKVKTTESKLVQDSTSTTNPLIYLKKTDSSQKLLGLTNDNLIIQSTLEFLPYSTDKNKKGEPFDLKKEFTTSAKINTIKINYDAKQFVLLLYQDGEIQKMPIIYFQSSQYNYSEKIIDFIFVNDNDKIFITTKSSQLIAIEASQFKEGKKQPSIKLEKGDSIITINYYDINKFLLVVTDNNFVNLVSLKEFPVTGKGGKGVRYYKQGTKTGIPIITELINDTKQEVYLETDTYSKPISLTKLSKLGNKTVIGQKFADKVKSIIPLNQ